VDRGIACLVRQSGPRRHALRVAGDPATLRFTIDGTVFKPFYETYGRYSVYLHVKMK
jgi:hypothetical protein